MAELLVMVTDKTNADKVLDAQCYKRGDVVAVKPDGWRWGIEELKRTDLFRVLKMPGVDPDTLQDLTVADVVDDGKGTATLVAKRARKLAIEKLDSRIVQKIDAVDLKGEGEVALSAAEVTAVLAARETKGRPQQVKVG